MQQAIFQINHKTYHVNFEDDFAKMVQTVDDHEFETVFMTAFREYLMQKSKKPLAYHRLDGAEPFDVPDDFDDIDVDGFDGYLKDNS